MSIYDYLRGYTADRFHTPGHKGELCGMDITEIEGEFPGDMISEAEKKTAKLYGAEHLRYLVNGSSIGIKAAILAAGGDIVSEGYRHRAVDEGARLAGVRVHTIDKTNETGGDALLPDADDIIKALEKTGAAAAVVQYPDYYGRCADLETIYKKVKAAGKILIADSAHGAHFAFAPGLFPKSATLLSDACNLSAHKTLNAYTQTAYLAYGNRMKARGIEQSLENLGTTSPNYVFMAQLESAADEAEGNDYARLKAFVGRLKNAVPCLDNDDCTRVVLDCRSMGGGKKIFTYLRSNDIIAEKFDDNYVILILTPADTDEKLDRLYKILNGRI